MNIEEKSKKAILDVIHAAPLNTLLKTLENWLCIALCNPLSPYTEVVARASFMDFYFAVKTLVEVIYNLGLPLEKNQLTELEKKYTEDGEKRTPFKLIRDFYEIWPIQNTRRDFFTFYASVLTYERKESWLFDEKIDSNIFENVLVLINSAANIFRNVSPEGVFPSQAQTEGNALTIPFLLSEVEMERPFEVVYAFCSRDSFINQRRFILRLFESAAKHHNWTESEGAANYLKMVDILKMMEACYHLGNTPDNKS